MVTHAIFPGKLDIAPAYRAQEILQRRYLLGGELHYWEGDVQEVYSPIYGSTNDAYEPTYLGYYPKLSGEVALHALESAKQAYNHGRGEWPTMSVEQRIKHVQLFAELMKAKRDQVVNLLMWEIAKSYKDAQKEFDRTVDYILDTIDALKELDRVSSRFVIENSIAAQIRRAPLGVVLCMGPYNYPLNETFTLLIPALIMGNSVLFKPPKQGVLLHQPLLEALQKAFPPGVINTVYGDGSTVVGPIMESGDIDVLAFIGSSKVADILKKQHPKPHRMRAILGLEAKNAGIILPDADLEQATDECVLGSLSYNGQRCTALKILFVHRKVIDAFLQKFCAKISSLKGGMPYEEHVKITPMPSKETINYLQTLIEDAKNHGAKVVNQQGGETIETFMEPAVLYPVTQAMRVYHEEQFGPVVPIIAFDTLEEPISYVVESKYGQQLSIFGQDSTLIADLLDPLVNQVCRVNINSQCQRGPDSFPFTGRKDSAENTLSVSDALRVFSIRTLVAAKENTANTKIIREIIRERKSNFLSTDFIF